MQAELVDLALWLSRQRQAAVPSLIAAVEACLADLAMPGSCFDVQLAWTSATQVGLGTCKFFKSQATVEASYHRSWSSRGRSCGTPC